MTVVEVQRAPRSRREDREPGVVISRHVTVHRPGCHDPCGMLKAFIPRAGILETATMADVSPDLAGD